MAWRRIQDDAPRREEHEGAFASGFARAEEDNTAPSAGTCGGAATGGATPPPGVIQLPQTQYIDYSTVLPHEEKGEAGPSVGNHPTSSTSTEMFPTKLHRILSRPDFAHIISWCPHGRAWRVHSPDAFANVVAPQYFQFSNFASFMRQVNGWGFHRIGTGPDEAGYYHELFLRGMPHLLRRMKRYTTTPSSSSSFPYSNKCGTVCTKVKNNSGTSGSYPAATSSLYLHITPDFYEMAKARPLPLKNPLGYEFNEQDSKQSPSLQPFSTEMDPDDDDDDPLGTLTPLPTTPTQQQQGLSHNFHYSSMSMESILQQSLLMANTPATAVLTLQLLLQQQQQQMESLSSPVRSSTTLTADPALSHIRSSRSTLAAMEIHPDGAVPTSTENPPVRPSSDKMEQGIMSMLTLPSDVSTKREDSNAINTLHMKQQQHQQKQNVERKQEEWKGLGRTSSALTLDYLLERQRELLSAQRRVMCLIQEQDRSSGSSSSPSFDDLPLDDGLFLAEASKLPRSNRGHESARSSLLDKMIIDFDQLEERGDTDDLLT